MFVLSQHKGGYNNCSAHFNGTATTTLGDFAWIQDAVYVLPQSWMRREYKPRGCARHSVSFRTFSTVRATASCTTLSSRASQCVRVHR